MSRQGRPILARVPLLSPLVSRFLRWRQTRALKSRSPEEIFSDIYRRNDWGGDESVSGKGSGVSQTGAVIAALPALFAEFHVQSMLDIPCGDFHWMRSVNLEGVSYLGADIVEALIEQNQRHATKGIAFRHLNVIQDPLPKVDLIFCRDCLVHFSFEDIYRALRNLCASGSGLLLTTTFPARGHNAEIATGKWRPLNLQAAPFGLPPPLKLISENYFENDRRYADKSLGLWRLSDIATRLTR